MATLITVKHNFETAHRLPFLGGKCESLHGHSWWAEFEIENLAQDVDANGIAFDFGWVKRQVRWFIDAHLDHGTMLGAKDPLLEAVLKPGAPKMDKLLGKLFLFGYENEDLECPTYADKPWPTVEAVAEMLCVRVQELLEKDCDERHARPFVNKVTVTETHVNKAIYLQGV